MDAVRLLPVLGLALWMVPLFWSVPGDPHEPTRMSDALWYIFGAWAALFCAALFLWSMIRRTDESGSADTDG